MAEIPRGALRKQAHKVVSEILDYGMKWSTWAETFPDAYFDLKRHYRADLEQSVIKILKRRLKKRG